MNEHLTGDREVTHSYYKLRYDFHADETAWDVVKLVYELAQKLDRNYHIEGILGEENRNKYGEEVKRHLHFHFSLAVENCQFSFREKLIYQLKKKYHHGRQRGWYSLVHEPELENRERFFRYPLKQYSQYVNYWTGIRTPEEFDIESQRLVANEEWERDREFLCAKRDKNNRKETTYERVLAKYSRDGVKPTTRKAAFLFVMAFFKEEGFPPDRLKIRSILDGLCLKTGLLSMDDFYAGI